VFELVMLLALVGGLWFVMKVLAKENNQEKALSEHRIANSEDDSIQAEMSDLEK